VLDLLRRNPDFRKLFAAQVVSFTGDWFANVALIGLLLDLTGSDLAAGGVFVASTLPNVLFTPLAGPAADRFDRRRLMLLVSLVQALAAGGFLLVGRSTVWLAFVAQGTVAGLGAFIVPASGAAVPNLVAPEDLPTATAMGTSTWGAMLAMGAALGGAFTAVFGRDAAFVADAVTFLVAAALIASVRRSMGGAGAGATGVRRRMHPIADSREALSYARRRPEILALLGSKMGFGLAGGIVGLLAVYATESFGTGDGGIGALLGARGAGVVGGSLIARRLISDDVGRLLRACGTAALAFATAYALLPVAPAIAPAVALVLAAHLGGGVQWTLSTYGLQALTPDELRGRILAADFALVMSTTSVSFFVAGAAAEQFGVGPVTLVFATINGIWGLVYLSITRRFRDVGPPATVTADG
jgi:MFS family permease